MWDLILVKSWSCPIHFQNQTTKPTFFKNCCQLHRHSSVFLKPNFRITFFCFIPNKFKAISHINLKAISIFGWTFFLVRFIFKGISYIKLKGNSPFLTFLFLFINKGISFLEKLFSTPPTKFRRALPTTHTPNHKRPAPSLP